MHKLLIICGPTATGKTRLGIHLAKKFNGEIISADSRQVYKTMDVGTGKEWGEIPIYGYDLVEAKDNFSVSHFLKFAKTAISSIHKQGKLPILVGGTGLYIKAVIDGIPTLLIPSNKELREKLDDLTKDELYEKLATIDPVKAASLNQSDRKNPRRLIRAIEVAIYMLDHNKMIKTKKESGYDILMLGLTAPKEYFEKKVPQRIENRMNLGFVEEVEELLKKGVTWKDQSMSSLGYKEAEAFFKKGETYEDFINLWSKNELKYVKRQLTWFKNDKRIKWFDITENDFIYKVEKLVKLWNNKGYGKKG